jgi:hypothetical protein
MHGKGTLAFKAGEDSIGSNAFAYSSCQRNIAFPEPQHLNTLNDSGISGGTRCTDCVMRTGQTQVDRDFSRRVVGHGSGVVVMRPILNILIIMIEELANFSFRFNISVFRDTEVDTNCRWIQIVQIQACVEQSFMSTVYSNSSGTRAYSDFFAILIFRAFEIANACGLVTHIANREPADSAFSF